MTTPPNEPPPEGGHPAEPSPAAGEPPRCPRCGAPHDPLQEYCLECGLRLVPLPGATFTRETIWTRDSPIWLWLALAALLAVALAAGAIVALAATDDDDQAAGGSVPTTGQTTPVPTTTGVPPVDTLTSPTTITIGEPTTTGTTTTLPTTTGTTTGTGGTISWPVGEDGYTVVLRSTPTSEGRGPAESAAQQAKNNGLPEVGILESSDFSSLNPGYYVTFTGTYDTENEAVNALPRARSSGFPTAYVRQVAD